jgi:hypothetical protein
MNNKENNNLIECPKCHEHFELTEAFRDSITEKMEVEISGKYQKKEEEIKIQLRKELENESSLEIKDLKAQLEETKKHTEEAQKAELSARKKEREAEQKVANAELEIERKVSAREEKIKAEVRDNFTEEYKFKEKEQEKKMQDLLAQVEIFKRKAEQGSQQLQGEVQELDLEANLKDAFPQDIIEPIGKGVKGADVRQKVRSNSGKICGIILWESKRTQNWSNDWIEKLKGYLRAEAAHIPVIMSSALPDEAVSGLGQKDGVWICKPSLAISLASILRHQLLEVAIESSKAEKQGTLAESLYDYVTSHEFRQQVEAMVEVYKEMKDQVVREKVAYEKSWKMREAQVEKMFIGTARIVGSIQGKLGNSAFGPVKGLELLESGETNSDSTS